MELNIYEIEERVDKNNNPYLFLTTDIGDVYCFPNDFEGDIDRVKALVGVKADCGVTAGDYPKLKVIKELLGKADEKKKPKDRDRTISRIACVNSAVKMGELIEEKDKKKLFELAEEIFSFINE